MYKRNRRGNQFHELPDGLAIPANRVPRAGRHAVTIDERDVRIRALLVSPSVYCRSRSGLIITSVEEPEYDNRESPGRTGLAKERLS